MRSFSSPSTGLTNTAHSSVSPLNRDVGQGLVVDKALINRVQGSERATIRTDEDIVRVCETFISAAENFFSEFSPYAQAEAVGLTGLELEQARGEQLRLFSYIEVLGRHICASEPEGFLGLDAKLRAAAVFSERKDSYDLDIADLLDLSCLNDRVRLVDERAREPSPGRLDWRHWLRWLNADQITSGLPEG